MKHHRRMKKHTITSHRILRLLLIVHIKRSPYLVNNRRRVFVTKI